MDKQLKEIAKKTIIYRLEGIYILAYDDKYDEILDCECAACLFEYMRKCNCTACRINVTTKCDCTSCINDMKINCSCTQCILTRFTTS